MSNPSLSPTWWRAALRGALLAAGCVTAGSATAGCVTDDGHESLTWVDAYPWHEHWELVDSIIGGPGPAQVVDSCTPYELRACDGGFAVHCNADGDGYALLLCHYGCAPEAGGCTPPEPTPGESGAQATLGSRER
jgi:hypothetical protein